MISLDTPRLSLRPPSPEDAPDFFDAASDWEVARYTARIPHPYPRENADAFVKSVTAQWANGTRAGFVARHRITNAFIGMVGLEFDGGDAILGYLVARSAWGKGYGGEAARAVVDYGFRERGITRLLAAAVPENTASHKILETLGMTRTEKVLEDAPARDAPNWVYRYVLTVDAWRETRT